jgi:hypothetical protein
MKPSYRTGAMRDDYHFALRGVPFCVLMVSTIAQKFSIGVVS